VIKIRWKGRGQNIVSSEVGVGHCFYLILGVEDKNHLQICPLQISLLVYLFPFKRITCLHSYNRKIPIIEKKILYNAKLPWPSKVDLPITFRPELVRALEKKEDLTPKLRSAFVGRMFEHFSKYTW
jgi:hypothetical protein